MKQSISNHLAALPRLDRANAWAGARTCKVCTQPSLFFDVTDFNKSVGGYRFGPAGVEVPWYRCDACGFLFTSFFDDWTPEEFRRWIYNDDYVKLDPEYLEIRPRRAAEQWAKVLRDHQRLRILDYGGGSGVFAERMRALGFRNMEAYDPLSLPKRPSGTFDIITCIEVIEHAPQPREFLADVRSFLHDEGCIVIGESLQPKNIEQIKCNWWYVAPRNGHVSIYADRTFARLANQSGMVFHRGEGAPHVLRTGDRLCSLAERCGPALSVFRLGAPGKLQAPAFFGIEGVQNDRFQWTGEREISWHIAVPGKTLRTVQISLPYEHEARPGFAVECTIKVAGKIVRPEVRGRNLEVEIATVPAGEFEVVLSMPEPNASNGRDLGLALRVI